MGRRARLGEFEHLVLLTALSLGERAYAPEIAKKLEQRAKREMSRGTLYAALDRLESRGLVECRVESGSAERGGRRRRRFTATSAGIESLTEQRDVFLGLWKDVDGLLEGGGA